LDSGLMSKKDLDCWGSCWNQPGRDSQTA